MKLKVEFPLAREACEAIRRAHHLGAAATDAQVLATAAAWGEGVLRWRLCELRESQRASESRESRKDSP